MGIFDNTTKNVEVLQVGFERELSLMGKIFNDFIMPVILALFFVGGVCGLLQGVINSSQGPVYKEVLKDHNILGEHQLSRLDKFVGVNGALSGCFFLLGAGSVQGQLTTEINLQFFWSPQAGTMVSTTVPYSRFLFVLDESKKVPTVEFVFDNNLLDNSTSRKEDFSAWHPNDFFKKLDLKVIRVRLNRATLEREVYLPKGRHLSQSPGQSLAEEPSS